MILHKDFERFLLDYYKNPQGQRLGQAFCNTFVKDPNPALFYDPSNERAKSYIIRNYVATLVREWDIPNGKVQLVMTEKTHALIYISPAGHHAPPVFSPIGAPLVVKVDGLTYVYHWPTNGPAELICGSSVESN